MPTDKSQTYADAAHDTCPDDSPAMVFSDGGGFWVALPADADFIVYDDNVLFKMEDALAVGNAWKADKYHDPEDFGDMNHGLAFSSFEVASEDYLSVRAHLPN